MNRAQKTAWFTLAVIALAITVNYLPWMVLGGMFVVMLVQSIVILQQYGWTDKETNHE
jgi:hypothetical protein